MNKIWIHIYFENGVTQIPLIFLDKKASDKRKKETLKNFNPDLDKFEVFEWDASPEQYAKFKILAVDG